MGRDRGGRSRGGFGRGGCGQGRFNPRKNGNSSYQGSSKNKENELKSAPQGNNKGTTSTYNTVKDAIINNIQKNYNNG